MSHSSKSHRVISVTQRQPAKDIKQAEVVSSVVSTTKKDLIAGHSADI